MIKHDWGAYWKKKADEDENRRFTRICEMVDEAVQDEHEKYMYMHLLKSLADHINHNHGITMNNAKDFWKEKK